MTEKYKQHKKHKTKLHRLTKLKLEKRITSAVAHNKELLQTQKKTRTLSPAMINDRNVISMFESNLSRTLEIQTDELTDKIFVVKTFYFGILEDLVINGFTYNGEHYRILTASAGQIRTKRCMFIKTKLWEKYEQEFMCGLTIDKVNQRGGINTTKFLSYLALLNSSTDKWEDFDVARVVVVDDFETVLKDRIVDFIDETDYSIERKPMDIEIQHSDGAGMVLPRLGNKNFMVRAPWIKGLLSPFDFHRFICEANERDSSVNHGLIKDIWGREVDVIAEDITVVLTKSQFKLWNFYDSWEEYASYFIRYGCEASKCNEEPNHIKNAVINYQMLQTLNKMTDKELKYVASKSAKRIENITSDVSSMLSALKATKENQNKTPYQKSLLLYPEMLTDTYTKRSIREMKDKMVQQYRSGRLEVNGKYLFLIPDLYAACEFWFLGEKNPRGLLADGEVFCRLYKNAKELNVLRSPHLSREHAVREVNCGAVQSEWFITRGVYTSSHDLISKFLMFDNDGDMGLIVNDHVIIDCAKRHMEDIVPLHYHMKKAAPSRLGLDRMYQSMIAAYTTGNIGVISNKITSIWNREDFNDECLEAVKLLTCFNNFCIDSAKTSYMPKIPEDINATIKKYISDKMPHFFVYLKDKNKDKTQVDPINKSVVNRLEKLIPNKRIMFPKNQLRPFDYKMLMWNPDIVVDEELVKTYHNLNCTYHYKINGRSNDDNNYQYINNLVMEKLSAYGYSDAEITDMLVKYFYHEKNSNGKALLWFCYGDILYKNLESNLNNAYVVCKVCGRRFIPFGSRDDLCDECTVDNEGVVEIRCLDCGELFSYRVVNRNKVLPLRCESCAEIAQYRQNLADNIKRRSGG